MAKISFYQESGLEIGKSVDKAVNDLPENSLIKAFILSNRAEVKRRCITEYNEVNVQRRGTRRRKIRRPC